MVKTVFIIVHINELIMKYTLFLIFAFCMSFSSLSQSLNWDSIQKQLLEVIKLKHSYESSVMLSTINRKMFNSDEDYNLERNIYTRAGAKSIDTAFAEYKDAISIIKKNKKDLLNCFEIKLNEQSDSNLFRSYIVYDYEHPYNSFRDKHNTMSRMTYYRIFKSTILDLDMDVLPSLQVALLLLNKTGYRSFR